MACLFTRVSVVLDFLDDPGSARVLLEAEGRGQDHVLELAEVEFSAQINPTFLGRFSYEILVK